MSDLLSPFHRFGHDPDRDAVFLAVLTGLCANPAFHATLPQPVAVVELASEIVSVAFDRLSIPKEDSAPQAQTQQRIDQ